MAMFKAAFFLALCLFIFDEVRGKPTNLENLKDGDLMKEFVEFLREDKEISAALEKEFNSPHVNRQRRQTELDDMNKMNLDDINQQKQQDGFFDRAAKFMMELLQRFLKWVNTE